MKIKHLLIGLFAVAATVACKQDEPVETPSLEVSQESLELTATEAEASFDVTSNVAWTATADQDWVSLDPASGDASKKAVAVTVTAEDNTATEARTATVTVKAGDLTKTVALTQAAAEAEDPGEDPGTDPIVPEVTELYMLGQACDTGWSIDNMTAFELVEGLWVWEGNLKVDDFRFPLQKQSGEFWPCLVPTTEGKVVYATGDNQVENPYRVESEGCYKVVVNVEEMTVTFERTGDYVQPELVIYILGGAINENADAGWKLENMQAFENNNGIYTWTGHLRRDEFRFPLQRDWWPCYMISADGESLVYGTSDNDKVQYRVQTPGVYTITIDATDPENPTVEIELVEADPGVGDITYTVTGTLANEADRWNTSAEGGLMTKEGHYYVAKNLSFLWRSTLYADAPGQDFFQLKVCETGTWTAYCKPQDGIVDHANVAIEVSIAGSNIDVHAPEGTYDVYLDKANSKVWVMKAGYAPGDEVPEDEQPEQPTITYVVAGTIEGDNWNNAGEKGRMTLEGDYYVAKDLPFLTSDAIYADGKPIEFKVLHSGTWDCYGQVEAGNKSANTEIAVKWGGDNIAVAAPAGNYDVYFDKTNLKVWFMKAGYAPGDEVPEDEQPENPNFQVSELYMLGPGSEVGWNLGLITPFKKVDDVWVWEGNLYPNEPFRFQLAKDNQWAPSLTPSDDGKSVYRTEGQNSNYRVESAGFYKVTVNPLTGALDVEKLGDNRAKSLIYELFLIGNAVPAHGGQWLLQKDHPFTNVDGVFTWEGELVPGSIRPVPHVFDWQPTIQKKSDTELELVYGYSSSDITIAEAGKYTLVINAKDSDNITYTLTKHEEPKPEPVLTLAANEASVAADATSYEVALTANCAWEAVATDGVTVTPATGEGDATVTLTFAANEVTSPVTHSVTFSAGEGLTAVLTLTQAAAEKPVIADGKYYIVANGKVAKPLSTGYGYLQVTNGKDNSSANAFNFTYVAAQKAYTIQDNSGQYYYQSGTYDSYNRQSNLPSDNSGYWTIEEENGAYRITNVLKKKYVQFDLSFGTYGCYATAKGILPTLLTEGTDVPYVIINPMSVNVNADATSAEFDIQTDMPWTAVVAEGDATLSSYSGSENATVTVTFAANKSTEASNTYKVKVSTEYGDEVITISQSKVQTGSMVTDELTAALFKATSTTYTEFTGVSVTSSAVYAGKSAKTSTGGIQLRSSKSEDGIVTTTSGGNVRTVVVTWEDGTTAGRTLDVYGSNVAYASAADLYGDNKGTKLGSIVKGTSTTLEVTGDYAYVGFRSNDGAMYLAKIEVTYE